MGGGHQRRGGRCLPAHLKERLMHESKAVIRQAELIKNRSSDDRVHMWRVDKRSWVLCSLFSLPEDPVLISHSACYVFSPNGDHWASFNSFSNLTVKVSRRRWLADVDLRAIWGNIVRGVSEIQNTAEGFGNTQSVGRELSRCWTCAYIPALPQTCCVTLHKSCHLPGKEFPLL